MKNLIAQLAKNRAIFTFWRKKKISLFFHPQEQKWECRNRHPRNQHSCFFFFSCPSDGAGGQTVTQKTRREKAHLSFFFHLGVFFQFGNTGLMYFRNSCSNSSFEKRWLRLRPFSRMVSIWCSSEKIFFFLRVCVL